MRVEQAWTSERERELARLVDEGHSAALVGSIMGISKNAAIGKAKRLRLTWAFSRGPSLTQEESNFRRSESRRSARAAAGKQTRTPRTRRAPSAPSIRLDAPPPEMRQLAFMELERDQCRWPIDAGPGAPNLYCGVDTKETYCPFHRMHSCRVGYVKRDPVAARLRTREMRRLAEEAIRERAAR